MVQTVRSRKRDERRKKRREKKRREALRVQTIANLWGIGEVEVRFATVERIGPSTFYCPECGILELSENEDGAPLQTRDPVRTNFHGVRNEHDI